MENNITAAFAARACNIVVDKMVLIPNWKLIKIKLKKWEKKYNIYYRQKSWVFISICDFADWHVLNWKIVFLAVLLFYLKPCPVYGHFFGYLLKKFQ